MTNKKFAFGFWKLTSEIPKTHSQPHATMFPEKNHRVFPERALVFGEPDFLVTTWMQRIHVSWHPCSQLTALCMLSKSLTIDNSDCTSWWGTTAQKFERPEFSTKNSMENIKIGVWVFLALLCLLKSVRYVAHPLSMNFFQSQTEYLFTCSHIYGAVRVFSLCRGGDLNPCQRVASLWGTFVRMLYQKNLAVHRK